MIKFTHNQLRIKTTTPLYIMSVVLEKTALTKEMLAELRIFEQHAMPYRGEEVLSVMNVDGRWYCMKGPELIAQLQRLPSQAQLSDYMVRNFRSPHTQRTQVQAHHVHAQGWYRCRALRHEHTIKD